MSMTKTKGLLSTFANSMDIFGKWPQLILSTNIGTFLSMINRNAAIHVFWLLGL